MSINADLISELGNIEKLVFTQVTLDQYQTEFSVAVAPANTIRIPIEFYKNEQDADDSARRFVRETIGKGEYIIIVGVKQYHAFGICRSPTPFGITSMPQSILHHREVLRESTNRPISADSNESVETP